MQSLQTMAKPPSQPSANLPPLQNLPSWSRSSLERSRPPRPIVRDKLQPIKSIVTDTKFAHESMATADDSNEKTNLRIVSAPSYGHETDPYQRVVHMQNSIDFLRNQQSDILERLHAEIERLKAENKELNFKLVMARSGVNLHRAISPLSAEEEDLLLTTALEGTGDHKDRIRDKEELVAESCISTKQSVQTCKRQPSGKKIIVAKPSPTAVKSASEKTQRSAKLRSKQPKDLDKCSASRNTSSSKRVPPVTKQEVAIPGRQSVLMVTIKDKSIQVHLPSEGAPRSPTLSECKAIIKHQQDANQQQAQELSKLKTDLEDVMVTSKWKPDIFMPAKSYHGEGRHGSSTNREQTSGARGLPRLPVRESERLTARMHVGEESISLPVLRPNYTSNLADRKRRQQAVLRARGTRRDYNNY